MLWKRNRGRAQYRVQLITSASCLPPVEFCQQAIVVLVTAAGQVSEKLTLNRFNQSLSATRSDSLFVVLFLDQ